MTLITATAARPAEDRFRRCSEVLPKIRGVFTPLCILGPLPSSDVGRAAKTVLKVLSQKMSSDEVDQAIQGLPRQIRELWEEARRPPPPESGKA